jgi:hypothetical protein
MVVGGLKFEREPTFSPAMHPGASMMAIALSALPLCGRYFERGVTAADRDPGGGLIALHDRRDPTTKVTGAAIAFLTVAIVLGMIVGQTCVPSWPG